MSTASRDGSRPTQICLSLGIMAWNEEESIEVALESLFEQSVFAEFARRNLKLELLVLANGCTDQTVPIVRRLCDARGRKPPFRQALEARCYDLQERGRNNAWNLFVHEYSAKEARGLFLMDGDIVLRHPDTIWNMYRVLEDNPNVSLVSDEPIKDISLRPKQSLRHRISLSTSRMNQAAHALITGQLYGIKAAVVRNIYLPRDLVACEDGLIRALACTYFGTRELDPHQIVRAENASHVFEAYTALPDIIKNQKRQLMGQTIVHVLVDQYLKTLPAEKRLRFAAIIRENELQDPSWLRRLINAHLVRVRFFWRLFPGLLSFRFQRLGRLKGLEKIRALPAALAGSLITLLSSWLAWRFLVRGYTTYWPHTKSTNLRELKNTGPGSEPGAPPSETAPAEHLGSGSP